VVPDAAVVFTRAEELIGDAVPGADVVIGI
jgi:hypothetical protein